ncbi:type II toxin-antitoxin system Phd/YefM family antitoxin [Nakamurella lactea]|jgi:prevent-host-death family protein|uniref:type II toxin-antitoxin system Phd/YefM family antitoxin n=1 Tax=Nakamurella lactea TaxID=459515 RepID=UPI0012B60203|nr:type II toxin-antitoxin system Phd/YefM family antitoxin [Nakamurella lactea]
MKLIPISEAKPRMAALVEQADTEDVVLTRHGRPVAVLLSSRRYEELLERLEDAEDSLSVYQTVDEPVVDAEEFFASLGLTPHPAAS